MKLFYTVLLCSLLSFASLAQVPQYTATVYDSAASTGYYFFSTGLTLIILDKNGDVVYYKNGPHGNGFCLQPNGLMSYADFSVFYLMDSTFTIVDSVECKNLDECDPHDLQILPDGHFLLLGNDIEIMDLSQYSWDGEVGSDSAIVECSVIQELDENKNVVFEWHSKDNFIFNEADSFFVDLSGNIQISWTHANSVELDTDGNILFSMRHFNEITKINRSDSSVMWRLGGTQNEFTFINSPYPFYGQHAARRLANGHLLLFDNGANYILHGARAVEFELDETNKIATQTWSYTFDSTQSSRSQGNAQRLGNSNTLVNFGAVGFDTTCFVVVDSNGSKIFQLQGPVSYRAFNYPSLPWQLHRPQISCLDSLGVTYLDAGGGYASYAWNNGDTTRIIPVPAVLDTFYVFVPYGEGGYISSPKFIVVDTSNICSALYVSGLDGKNTDKINVFPNPMYDKLTLGINAKKAGSYHLKISDVSGKAVISKNISTVVGKNSFTLDMRNVSKGIYMLQVQSDNMDWKTKVVVE